MPREKVRRRNSVFASRPVTRIWQEEASESNPYLASACRCHGYDMLELAAKRNFADVLFLLFVGELPTPDQARLLETLLIACITPGPRHPAARAAMNAAVSRTNPAHILPLALTVNGGGHLGAEEVEASMRFLRKNQNRPAAEVAGSLPDAIPQGTDHGDVHPVPGFGSRFGGVDPLAAGCARLLLTLAASGRALHWGNEFAGCLNRNNRGWLMTGVVAAGLVDLGIDARAGGGLYQLLSAPGLLAQGMEFANKPITALPFLGEDQYAIEPTARRQR
ncbi:MAG: citrate synthase [Thermodesulfobacteriota bacterium]